MVLCEIARKSKKSICIYFLVKIIKKFAAAWRSQFLESFRTVWINQLRFCVKIMQICCPVFLFSLHCNEIQKKYINSCKLSHKYRSYFLNKNSCTLSVSETMCNICGTGNLNALNRVQKSSFTRALCRQKINVYHFGEFAESAIEKEVESDDEWRLWMISVQCCNGKLSQKHRWHSLSHRYYTMQNSKPDFARV